VVTIVIMGMVACSPSGLIRKSGYSLEVKEINGIKLYKRGEYKKAFELLKVPATWGYKGSQYAIAFMFLKGQYVEQSTLLGMAWLGVAAEAKVPEWTQQYNDFYNAASAEQQQKIDNKVTEYIGKFGMEAQHVTCSTHIVVGTRSHKVDCHKYDQVATLYEIELSESSN
jgi:TPR repeat protein